MRYISVFSGIEAASVAWGPLGWEPVCFSEIDPFPSAVLAERYQNVPNLGDITKIDWHKVVREYGAVDVVVGGSPCQSFSIAGGRESLDGESRLMYEYIRACEEIQSPWIVWENVPGVLSTRDGAFWQLLENLQRVGYVDLAWRVLDAQFFGVAQRRRRVFLVGHLGTGGCSAAVLFEPESVRGNTKTSKEKREELARGLGEGFGAGGKRAIGFAENQQHKLRLTNGDGSISVAVPAFPGITQSTHVVMASGQANAEISEGGAAPTVTLLHEALIVAKEKDGIDVQGAGW